MAAEPPHGYRRAIMRSVSRRSLLGLPVKDCHGEVVGKVVDTWPNDGGFELELVIVRLPRFGARRMLPADQVDVFGGALFAPYSRAQIQDAPEVDRGRHSADDPYRAKAYWMWEESTLRAPWRSRSGSFATARRSRTSPSSTPNAS
jgi:hypothetical protein